MAECNEQGKTNASNDLKENFDDFCDNFSFSDTKSCCHCNGFYGPNCNEPLCVSCHRFLFSARKRKRLRNGLDTTVYKYYRHGRSRFTVTHLQPVAQSSSSRMQPQLKDLNKFFSEFLENQNNNDTNEKIEKRAVAAKAKPCSKCTTTIVESEYKSDTHISVLPVEMLLKIFSNLNDITLFDVSQVSEQWKQILDTQQEMWKKYTLKRWPLLQRKTETTNWLKMYTALESSCFCRSCANEMMQRTESSTVTTSMRRRAERDRLARFEVSGIRAVPLDAGKLARWQCSIAGPANSCYEGGTFYLSIYLPLNYPFEPPIIKFLTKIIHPNISRHGDIGLDVITWNYCLSLTINPMLLSIQSLLCDPFTKVCMEPELGRLYDQDRPRFDALARHWTKKYAMMDEISFDD